jgi:hypothetical protein
MTNGQEVVVPGYHAVGWAVRSSEQADVVRMRAQAEGASRSTGINMATWSEGVASGRQDPVEKQRNLRGRMNEKFVS